MPEELGLRLALGLFLGLFALLALDHGVGHHGGDELDGADGVIVAGDGVVDLDRKSTRLNSSHREKSRMPSSA